MSSILIKLEYMEFKDWLVDKFLELEKTQPKRQPYVAFARYLGVKQSAPPHGSLEYHGAEKIP
jgi:hypothetical protein